jgi:hypothetical protein
MIERVLEIGDQLVTDGIAFVWSIEREQRNAIALVQSDGVKVH